MLGLHNEADDNGVFIWHPLQLKLRLLPADTCEVAELLEELRKSGQVMPFEVDGKSYGIIRDFQDTQKPKKPTFQYPVPSQLPPGFALNPADDRAPISGPEFGTSSEAVPNQFGTSSEQEGTGTEPVRNQFGTSSHRRGGEGIGEEGRVGDPDFPNSRSGSNPPRARVREATTPEAPSPPQTPNTGAVNEIRTVEAQVAAFNAVRAARGDKPESTPCAGHKTRRAIEECLADPAWRQKNAEALAYVTTDPFYMGRESHDGKPFVLTLAWWHRPGSLDKVLESKQRREGSQAKTTPGPTPHPTVDNPDSPFLNPTKKAGPAT